MSLAPSILVKASLVITLVISELSKLVIAVLVLFNNIDVPGANIFGNV